MKFLVIEDDPGHAVLISRMLKKLFPTCAIETNQEIAGVLARDDFQQFTAVLSDLTLPDAEGLNRVRLLSDHMPKIPLIVLTSLVDEQMALQALENGAQDYLSKHEILSEGSAGEDKLRRAIHYSIQRQESQRENQRLVQQLTESKKLLETKNKRLEELCETSQRFVDNVSHEFRTPLTVIKEYSSLIRDGVIGDVNDEQVAMLNVIDDRTDDLNTMVDDLLDFSRLEAGLLGMYQQECMLEDIIKYLFPSLRRKAAVRNVVLELEIPDDLPCIWCDSEKIGRVIINLVVNAIKFCGEPGRVKLWALANDVDREVQVGVSDNGPGIPQEKLAEIFNRFEQHVTNVRQSTKGFGLGLGIAKELVDLNLGQMEVQSELGMGSDFIFTIPYAEYDEILQRQFTAIRKENSNSAEICVVSLRAKDVTDECDLTDLGMLLQQDLRRHDQLFRVNPRHWLAVLSMPPLELSGFTQRIENDRREISRNRPKGDLPEIEIKYRGSWQLLECSEEQVLAAIHASYADEEALHVCPT